MAADNERIAAWMRWYVHGIIQWRFAVILLLGAISIYLASHIGQLKVEVDTGRFLPQDHPYVVAQNTLERIFGGRDIVVIGVIPRGGDIYNPTVLAKVARITQRIDSARESFAPRCLA